MGGRPLSPPFTLLTPASERESRFEFKFERTTSKSYGDDIGASSIDRNPKNPGGASERGVEGMAWGRETTCKEALTSKR